MRVLTGFPLPSASRLFPTFFYIRLTVSFLLYKSLLHLELSFVQGGKYGFIWILTQAFICFDQHFVEDAVFFIQCIYVYVLPFYWKSNVHKTLDLFIGVYFRLTDQHVCFMQTSCFLIETRIQIAWLITYK